MTRNEAIEVMKLEVGDQWEVSSHEGWAENAILLERKEPTTGSHWGQLVCCAHDGDMILVSCPCSRGISGKVMPRYAVAGTVAETVAKVADHGCIPWGG